MIDIQQLIDLENEEILKLNGGKKFDIVLINPPYGSTGGNTIHLKFVDKCLEIANKQIVLMPITFVTKVNNEKLIETKDKFSKTLIDVDEVSYKEFRDTWMPNVGIYNFDANKSSKNITINLLPDNTLNVQSLNDITTFDDYEKSIINILSKNGTQEFIGDFGRLNSWKKQDEDKKETLAKILPKICGKYKDRIDGKACLMTSTYIPVGTGKVFTNNTGKIFTKYNDFIKYFMEHPYSRGTNLLIFDTIEAAENCKIALNNPLLRFTIYKLQDDQNLTKRIFKYVPNIDWSDTRTTTDEGLLELCGCPKSKCKEYADYCKKIIEKVDNK